MFWGSSGKEFLETYPQFRGRRLHMPESDIRHVVELREEFPFMSKSEIARRTGVSRPFRPEDNPHLGIWQRNADVNFVNRGCFPVALISAVRYSVIKEEINGPSQGCTGPAARRGFAFETLPRFCR